MPSSNSGLWIKSYTLSTLALKESGKIHEKCLHSYGKMTFAPIGNHTRCGSEEEHKLSCCHPQPSNH